MQPHLFTTSSQKWNKGSAVGSSENLGEATSNKFYTSASVLLYISSKFEVTLVPLTPAGYGPEKCIGLYIKLEA